MNPLTQDHQEMAADDIDDSNPVEHDEPVAESAHDRWLDGVDNGNRDYI
jgi:hypothetical protein